MICRGPPQNAKMNVTVVHGFAKIPLTIENYDEATVEQLLDQLEEKSGVPKRGQKLIFKGKTLSDASQQLNSLGLKPGAKLMLIGKKFSPEEDAAFKQLEDLKSRRQNLSDKLDEYRTDFENVSGGFLTQEHVPQRLEQLRKSVMSLSEQGMKLLTTVDGVRLGDETEHDEFPESVKSAFKTKRKSLTDDVNSLMDAADSLLEKVETFKSRQ